MLRFFRRRYWDDERGREIDAHLAIEIDDNIARGMTPGEARYAALRKLGNATLIREDIHQMNTIAFVDTCWQDLRHGARLLRLNPGFAAVALLSLALGIGANTAIFQLIDAVRLRTLPVANAHEIVDIHIVDMTGARGNFNTSRPSVTNPIWEKLRDDQQAFAGVFAWGTGTFDLATRGAQRFTENGLYVSGNFFEVLGVGSVLGRVFTAGEDRRGCSASGAVISHAFWQREFGGDRSVVGRTVSLDGHPFEIIGVTPASFFGLQVGHSYDVAIPICAEAIVNGEANRLDAGTIWWLSAMGRLKPGSSPEQAASYLASMSPGLFEATLPRNYPVAFVQEYLDFKLGAFPAGSGISSLRNNYSSPLWLLLALAGMVLLIACANLANLMLARASAREREIGVRLAIGASRGRVVRQLLAESLLLASIGASLGAVLAGAMSRALVSFLSTDVNPVYLRLDTDSRIFAFTAGIAFFCAMLFGLAPALRATRVSVGTVLKAGGRGLMADRERSGVRRTLVVVQVGLSLVLLMGALLFAGTFRNLVTLDVGFQQDGILEADVDLRRLDLPVDRGAMKRDLVDRIRTIPGVEAAAGVSVVPLTGRSWNNDVWIDGSDPEQRKGSKFNRVTGGYFRTLQIPLLAGRTFDDRDTPASPPVAIVNEAFARRFVSGANPVGKSFWIEAAAGTRPERCEIVGLVKDTKYRDLREDFGPIAFLAGGQDPRPGQTASILIRSSTPLAALMPAVSQALANAGPDIAFHFHVLQTEIRDALVRERLMATLSGFFGVLALLLATIGLYGVMSYAVTRRTHEIGIRMALGAGRREVLAMIMREATLLVGIGLAAGAVLGLAAARAAGTLLFGVTPGDPATLAAAVIMLAAAAALASYLPAARAARLEPTIALREE